MEENDARQVYDWQEIQDRLTNVERAAYDAQIGYMDADEAIRAYVDGAIRNVDAITAHTTYGILDEIREKVFHMACDLRILFQTHFEDGNCDITDEELWNIINAN